MGCEVLFLTASTLVGESVADDAIAQAGDLIDRGAKKRTDLYFLQHTEMPSIFDRDGIPRWTRTADAGNLQRQLRRHLRSDRDGDRRRSGRRSPSRRRSRRPADATGNRCKVDIEVVGNVTRDHRQRCAGSHRRTPWESCLRNFLNLLLYLAIIIFVAYAIVWVIQGFMGWAIDPMIFKWGQIIVGLLCFDCYQSGVARRGAGKCAPGYRTFGQSG